MRHSGNEMTGTGQLPHRFNRADGSLMSIDGPTRTVVPAHPLPRGHGLLRDLERPADVFAYLGPNWFASVMGTGIVATAAATLPVQWPGLRGFATAIWVLSALWLAFRLAAVALYFALVPAWAVVRGRTAPGALPRRPFL